jgi:septal ring factor EnvC (AmiA/AmiB activator)
MEGREMTDLDERTPWQHLANARMTTLEAARKRHAKKISLHGGLLTAMDHDVTNAQLAFRAQLSVLNALRETQNEQAEGLTGVETRLTSVETRLTGVETRLTGVETRLTGVETRLTSVEGTLKKVHVGVDAIQLMLRRMEEKEAGGNPPA